MRRRLILSYLALLTLVLLALEIPLASYIAAGRTEEVLVDRLLDATRLAAVAEPALRDRRFGQLGAELERYHELYGIVAAVADQDAILVAVAGDLAEIDQPAVRGRLGLALAGDRGAGHDTVWPWHAAPLAVAVPVTSGGEIIGAVLTLSPTDRLRAVTLRMWALVGGAGLVAFGAFLAVAAAVARWILRPVATLDTATLAMASGDLEARAPADSGPPEVRGLARSFNEMAASLADAVGRQRAFVAQASHQLRNPLTALRIRVDNLARFVTADGRKEHQLALEETDRLGKILDGLLALAKAEGERQQLVEVDAATVADERVAAWQPLAVQRGIALLRSGSDTGRVLAVATGVDQALDALIDNALKFAGDGATVTVDVRNRSTTVEIRVVDDGPGLSERECGLAVRRLWRAPIAQNIDGAGLGLPIAAALMGASGGELALRPATPRGLAATLRFAAVLCPDAVVLGPATDVLCPDSAGLEPGSPAGDPR